MKQFSCLVVFTLKLGTFIHYINKECMISLDKKSVNILLSILFRFQQLKLPNSLFPLPNLSKIPSFCLPLLHQHSVLSPLPPVQCQVSLLFCLLLLPVTIVPPHLPPAQVMAQLQAMQSGGPVLVLHHPPVRHDLLLHLIRFRHEQLGSPKT